MGSATRPRGAVPGLDDIVLVTTNEAPVTEPGALRVVRTRADLRISGLVDAAVLRSSSGGVRRWLQLLRHPIALARRRGWLGGLESAAATAGDAAVRVAVAGETGGSAAAPMEIQIVCADGIDHLAAAAVIAEGLAVPAPGGLRHLGDVLARASDLQPRG